jgi:fructan beta-fructosidase
MLSNLPSLPGIARLLSGLLADRLGHGLKRSASATPKWRPLFHFTVSEGWLNDPNGLTFFNGRYHLFYQHIPYYTTHPPAFSFLHHLPELCWGHASSTDLLHWESHPPVLYPGTDGKEIPFSGSGVVSEGCLAVIFTHVDGGANQRQSLAWADEHVQSFRVTPGSPVLPNPGVKDFRDPKVIWYIPPDGEQGYWVMALAAGERVKFYCSINLTSWQFLSDFPPPPQSLFAQKPAAWGPVVECPDLFELPTPDGGRLWALTYCQGWWPGSREVGSFYRLGEFDGETFIPCDQSPRRLDYGPDYYAAQTWANIGERRIAIAWMNNWLYAEQLPTHPWRGQFSMPRELHLEQTSQGDNCLVQRPVCGLQVLDSHSGSFLDFKLELAPSASCGVRLKAGEKSQVIITWSRQDQTLSLDRRHAAGGLGACFARCYRAPLQLGPGEKLSLRVLVDRSSVEVFAQDGRVTLSALVFPVGETWKVEEFYGDG